MVSKHLSNFDKIELKMLFLQKGPTFYSVFLAILAGKCWNELAALDLLLWSKNRHLTITIAFKFFILRGCLTRWIWLLMTCMVSFSPLFPFFMFSNFYRANQKKSRNHLLANPPTCCCKYVYIVWDCQSCCFAWSVRKKYIFSQPLLLLPRYSSCYSCLFLHSP